MRKYFCLFITLLVLSSALFTGCGQDKDVVAYKEGQPVRVLTTFYPIYITTANVVRGVSGVQVSNMTKPQTGCLHDYQLTTEDMKQLEEADILVINGAGMEAFLDKIIEQYPDLKIVDASKDIDFIEEDGEVNPHVWLSVQNAIYQTDNIATQLAYYDPVNAKQYFSNSNDYIEKLERLQSSMHQELGKLQHYDIVTFHEAFPYFAHEFDLDVIDVVEREPGTAPTPAELEKTIEKVNSLPVKLLFAEPQYSPLAAQTIANETGAKIYALDPVVTGDANSLALDNYILTMHKNAETIKEAFSEAQ